MDEPAVATLDETGLREAPPTERRVPQAAFAHSTLSWNLFWLATSGVLSAGLNATINFLLARRLGVTAFGEWSLILASSSWILMWQTAVGSDLIRKGAQDREYGSRVFGQALAILLLGSAVLGGGSVLLNLTLLQRTGMLAPSVLAVLAAGVTALAAIPVSLFMARDRMHWNVTAGAQSLLLLILLVALAGNGLSVGAVSGAYLAAALAVALPVLVVGGWLLKPSLRGGTAMLRRTLGDMGQLFAINWLYMLHWTLDLYLLQLLRGTFDVGLYNAAFKLVILLRIVPSLLLMSVIPESARRAAAGDFGFLCRVWVDSTRLLLLVGGVLVLCVLVLADGIMQAAYTAAYGQAIVALMILSAAIVPLFSQSVIQSLSFAAGRYTQIIGAVAVGLAVQLAAGLALIPRLGAEGAAMAFLAAECAILAVLATSALGVIGRPAGATVLVRLLSVSAVAVGITLAGLKLHVAGGLLLPSMLALYVGLAYALGCVSGRDVTFGKALLGPFFPRRA